MMLYTIEYEVSDDVAVPRFGHTTLAAETAQAAVEEFVRSHPGAEITEMRKVHA